jgi:branched-chain amino acid transport system substrate-binding protein
MEREVGKGFAVDAKLDRRRFAQLAALSGATLLAGCGTSQPLADRQSIKLGYVSPQSGPLFGFGEADAFVVQGARQAFKDGLKVGGRTYPVDILVRDSQSDPGRAGEVARDLIAVDQVNLMLASSTPETTNPVADACEQAGMPCISTVTPYQPWYLGRNPSPDRLRRQPYRWTWHFFWGLEDIIAVFSDMWGRLENNQVVGGLWPDDGDGRTWSRGFVTALGTQGYQIVDPGRYKGQKDSFKTEIDQFKGAGVEILTGVPLPPDFATFWKQAAQQGYRPKIASVGKALLFPAFIEAMGTAEGVSTEVWWSPMHPFRSSLTGATAAQLADEYSKATGRQWIQPLGFVHALFEVAASVLKRAGDVDDRQALADAIKTTSMSTIVGPVDWTRGQADFPNVARTPLVGGQWRRGRTWPFELQIVCNTNHPEIPATSTLQPIA